MGKGGHINMKATFFNGANVKECDFFSPALISQLIRNINGEFTFPCGEKGICGKCRVRVRGKASPLSDSEKELLSEDEINSGIRLACCTFALGDVFIEYNEKTFSFSRIYDELRDEISSLDKDREYFAVFDIGTTTVKALLTDEAENDVKEFSFTNPQVKFGDNVLSRMEYAADKGGGELRAELEKLFSLFFDELNIVKSVITGNTAMLHLLLGRDVSGMIRFPFTPHDLFGYEKDGIYYPCCVSSFVGADMLCSALATGLTKKSNTLLIDLGTNGEMMYNHGGKIYCSSVSAGPAFEGYGIKFGSGFRNGAISGISSVDGEIRYSVSGGGSGKTICGSGIIDALALMREREIINKEGYLSEPYRLPGSDVYIFPEDIRSFQLAKAAVRAGAEALCEDLFSLDRIMVCGNFGSSLNIESCIKTGLLPDIDKSRYVLCGNAALEGAKMLLLEENRKKLGVIREKCISLNLAENEKFQKLFIKKIDF